MKRLALCTSDDNYSNRLRDYLGCRIEHEYSIMMFSKTTELIIKGQKMAFDMLIVDSRVWDEICDGCKEYIESEETTKVTKSEKELYINLLILVDNRHDTEDENVDNITADGDREAHRVYKLYKYSPAQNIIAIISELDDDIKVHPDVSNYYGRLSNMGEISESVRIIGIYSPVGGCGVTTIALSLAGILSEAGKVMYLSMEPFSPITEQLFLDDRYTLSEALYAHLSGSADSIQSIYPYISRVGTYSTIAPFSDYYELSKVTEDNWKSFIGMIADSGEYDYLIMELSDVVDGLVDIIELCQSVLIPEREGRSGNLKMKLFKEELKRMTTEDFYEDRVKFLKVPDYAEQAGIYENAETTKVGKWLRQTNAWL